MVTYQFYTETYKGTSIPNEPAFNSAVIEATAYVDSMIIHRDNLTYPQVVEKYNMAVCAAAEYVYKAETETEKSSESVGNHSISFVVKNQQEKEAEKSRRVRMYLAHTGLLYGGM